MDRNNNTPVFPMTPTPVVYVHEFTLPSGKHVQVREATGKDQRLALLTSGGGNDKGKLLYAIVAQMILIDKQIVPWEAIDAMPLRDVNMLLEEAQKVLNPPAAVSDTSLQAV